MKKREKTKFQRVFYESIWRESFYPIAFSCTKSIIHEYEF